MADRFHDQATIDPIENQSVLAASKSVAGTSRQAPNVTVACLGEAQKLSMEGVLDGTRQLQERLLRRFQEYDGCDAETVAGDAATIKRRRDSAAVRAVW